MGEFWWFALYSRLPVWAQNLACTIKGVQNHWRRYNRHFRRYLQWLRQSEWMPADRIREYQDRKLRELIQHAYNTVPFYKRWFDEHGVLPGDIKTQEDLPKLPVLTKRIVQENQDQLVSRSFKSSRLLKVMTSGTTGTPLRIRMTRQALAFQWAVWWRHRARFGLHPGDKYLSFGARVAVPVEQSSPPFWRRNWIGRQTYLATYHLTPTNLPAIVDWLNREDFDFYSGYPSAIYVLANYLLENGVRLLRRPKYVVCGADALLPTFENAIRKAFGVPVTEQYGMAEFAGNMAKCEYGRFHLDFECCCVEEKPIPNAPEPFKSLLFTGWGNPAMPFIRYEVGDYAKRCEQPCPCGRASLCFESIDGRMEDYLRTPDGRMVIGMNQVFEYAPGAREIQIYQEKLDSIEVRIVPRPSFDRQDEAALLRELRRRVGPAMEIRFVIVDHIPRTASGKLRAVVSVLDERRRSEQPQ